MARGMPDYGAYAAETYLAGMADNAELAVRLGSIDIFDRRGKVIDLDDFEAPTLDWLRGVSPGSTVELNSDDPKSAAQGVRLQVAAVIAANCWLDRGYVPFASKRIGAEISFSQPSVDTYFDIELVYFDGTNWNRFRVRIDFLGQQLFYWTDPGVWAWFANTDLFFSQLGIFYPCKLVVDFGTGRYARFLMGELEIDMSALVPDIALSGVGPHFETRFWLYNRVAAVRNLYIDDYILTVDEP